MKQFISVILLLSLGGCYSKYQAVHLYYNERVRVTAEDRMKLSVDKDSFVIECEDNRKGVFDE